MRRFFQLTLAAAALSLGGGLVAERRSRKATSQGRVFESEPSDSFEPGARRLTRGAIQYFLVPIWTAAGIADWWCHRPAKIEQTTGAKETLLHLLMLLEAGIPVTAGLLLEINPPGRR